MPVAGAEAEQLIRGAAGGLLFGVPLLYTMEVWATGSSVSAPFLLGVLAVTAVVVFLLVRTSGFRPRSDRRILDAAADTVVALGLAVVAVLVVLVVLRRVTLDTPLPQALGQVVYEVVPFALGVGLARTFLSGSRNEGGERRGGQPGDAGDSELSATMADLGAGAIGASFIAFSIAPTDEVDVIAASMTPGWLLALIALSLVVSYGIVFEAGFAHQDRRRRQSGLFQRPLTETLAAYFVSLVVATGLLVAFGNLDLDASFPTALGQVLVLGLPASVGGAAGRLAV